LDPGLILAHIPAVNVVEENLTVRMGRRDLRDLPEHPIPDGYTLRLYEPNDAANWVKIHELADRYLEISPALYEREFGTDHAPLRERQFYLLDAAGTAIGTASAWFEREPRADVAGTPGRVHWVAIVPEHQGRGLAKPLLAAVLRRLRDLGHSSAVLGTSTARVPAIRLYRQFGFEPVLDDDDSIEIWRRLEEHVGESFLNLG
jgi:GNAT superfamily N-acetyltransferase